MTPSVHFVLADERLLDRYRGQLGHIDRDQALRALAAAVSTSPAVPAGATLLLRGGDTPVLALVCPPGHERRVRRQVRAVHNGCRTMQYVDAAAARRLTARLARRLHDELGPVVGDVAYIPIPTGGRAVLDMLRWELEHHQPLSASPPARVDRPAVLVDDIALTGARFGQALATTSERPIVFAHLYSHPQLRDAIAQRHPDVRCLAAADLTDRAPAVFGERVAEWRRRSLAMLSPPRYWIGMTDHVCFPWNEPERGLFDRDTDTVEPAWSLVRPAKQQRRTKVSIEVVPDGTGHLRPAAGVIFLDVDDGVLVATAAHTTFMLRGAAATMWRALIATGDRTAILHEVVDRYDVDESVAARDCDALLTDLLRLGLIAQHDAA